MTGREAPMSMAELLDQDKVWYSRRNRELHREMLDEMDLEHIKSLRSWLLRNAESIQWGILDSLQQAGYLHASEQATYDIDRDIDRMVGTDPEVWMRETVLFGALSDRLENVLVGHLTHTNVATIMRLVKLALSFPPGTHTENQLKHIEAVRRKLEGTGRQT